MIINDLSLSIFESCSSNILKDFFVLQTLHEYLNPKIEEVVDFNIFLEKELLHVWQETVLECFLEVILSKLIISLELMKGIISLHSGHR